MTDKIGGSLKNNNNLYLLSSNAKEAYITGILETISLPFGTVQHFRYQLSLLDKNLREKLPREAKDLNEEFKKIRTVACYLYQEEIKGNRQWSRIYPIRTGNLVGAYKTGDTDYDVAHFYFKLSNYIDYSSYQNKEEILEEIRNISQNSWDKEFAFFAPPLEEHRIARREESKSIFYTICHLPGFVKDFRSPQGREYRLLFCYIDGLKKESGDFLLPKYDPFSRKSYYQVHEGARYSFEFSTCFPTQIEETPKCSIELCIDPEFFSTLEKYKLPSTAHYDTESWSLSSLHIKRDVWSDISLKISSEKINGNEFLNKPVNFSIKIRRNKWYLCIGIAGDIGFGVASVLMIYAKLSPGWGGWYWWVGIGYLFWAICKIQTKVVGE